MTKAKSIDDDRAWRVYILRLGFDMIKCMKTQLQRAKFRVEADIYLL